jgi:alkylation response protein AidB-like acyl-CoA dehydrogenase
MVADMVARSRGKAAKASIPTSEELVRRAAELAPLLRRHAVWQERHGRLHDETIEGFAAAGLFRLRVPRRYGGYEVDTRTLVDVAAELGRVDGSSAWVASVYWIPGWMACQFPDEVQDEVFATDNVRICGTLSPSAFARVADGGVVLNGKWGFISGALHSHWQVTISVLVPGWATPIRSWRWCPWRTCTSWTTGRPPACVARAA